MFGINGDDNFLEFLFEVCLARHPQDIPSLGNSLFLDQPAGAAGDAKKQEQEEYRGGSGDSQFPAPLGGAQTHRSQNIIRKIGEQNAEDNVELKQADEPAPPFCGRNLRDVHRAEHGRAADAKATDEAEKHQRRPVPCQSAAQGGDDIEHGHGAQTVSPAKSIAGYAGKHGADDRAPKRGGHRHSQSGGREMKRFGKRMGGAGNDGSVEPEQKAAERGYDCAFQEIGIEFHIAFRDHRAGLRDLVFRDIASTLEDRRSGDADGLVRAAVIEEPAVGVANHSFDEDHVWHLAYFFPFFFRRKNGLFGASQNFFGIFFVEENPAGGIKKIVVGAVVNEEDSL